RHRQASRVIEAGGDTVTTHYRLDGQSVVKESVDRMGTANDGTVTAPSATTKTRWHAYDGWGSALGEISGSTGQLTKARVYDVYGTVRAEDRSASQSRHRLSGKTTVRSDRRAPLHSAR